MMVRSLIISAVLSGTLSGAIYGMEFQAAPAPVSADAAQSDSSGIAKLDAKLEEYIGALEREPSAVKIGESDFLIGTPTDSAIRQRTAVKLYRHYLESPVMGDEAVAIHIYDRWFSNGEISMGDEAALYSARLFAETNRQSLIGLKAPEIALYDSLGNENRIPASGDGRFHVLYFYDTDCPKCRIENIRLKSVLDNCTVPVTLYAIYVGTDREKWSGFTETHFTFSSREIKCVNLWNPGMKTDLTFSYGVLGTPRMFLTDSRGTIIGRGLDSDALEQLFAAYAPKEMEYGSRESDTFFRNLFGAPDTLTCSSVDRIAGYIEKGTLQAGDTLLFRQMTGDLLYYIAGQREEAFKCGTADFVRKYILSRGDIWKTQDDSIRVVGFASLLKDLDGLAPYGSEIPGIRVCATLLRNGKARTGMFRTDRFQGRRGGIIIFHTEGCEICRSELEAAAEMSSSGKGPDILEVDMDQLFSSYPDQANALLSSFDLSSLPFIIETDRKGRVTRKYISLRK